MKKIPEKLHKHTQRAASSNKVLKDFPKIPLNDLFS